jgi:hypothetical protein
MSSKDDFPLSEGEKLTLAFLVTVGAAALDVPAGPAYVIKQRLEARFKKIITTEDVNNMIKRVQVVLSEGEKKT